MREHKYRYSKGGMTSVKSDDGEDLKFKIDTDEMSIEVDETTKQYLSDIALIADRQFRKLKDTYIFWYDDLSDNDITELEEVFQTSLNKMAKGGNVDEDDTFVMLFKGYGFVEKRGSYGTRTFYNKKHNAYIYYDPKFNNIYGYVGGGEGNDEVIPYSVEGVFDFFIKHDITESEATPMADGGKVKEEEYKKLYRRLKQKKEKGETLDKREEYALNKSEYILKTRGKMADGGYVNQYFGKGFENDAITELKKALPNHKFEKGKNKIIVDGGKFIISLDEGRYGFIREYNKEGSLGGHTVQKLDEAIDFIETNQMAKGGNVKNPIDLLYGLVKNKGGILFSKDFKSPYIYYEKQSQELKLKYIEVSDYPIDGEIKVTFIGVGSTMFNYEKNEYIDEKKEFIFSNKFEKEFINGEWVVGYKKYGHIEKMFRQYGVLSSNYILTNEIAIQILEKLFNNKMADGGNVWDEDLNVYTLVSSKEYFGSDTASDKRRWFRRNGRGLSREQAKRMAQDYIDRYGKERVYIGNIRHYR